nr:TraU family protein [Photobacterium kishitanii]
MINKKASLLCCLLMFLSTFVDAAPALERGIDNDGNPTRSSSTSLSILDLWNDSTANSFACTKYSVDGMCYWLKCSWYGCRVRTSMLVSHYNPDVTIEVIQTEKKLPLSPVSDFFHKIGKKVTETVISESSILGLGQGYRAGDGQRKGSGVPKQFHDAVAMGNPALPLYSNSVGMALGLVGWCQSDVMLYNPYFVSTASPEWRSGFLEGIYTLGNMLTLNNSIGGGFSGYAQWGTLYPRIGTAYHVDNSKSAGTIATRVANIITNKNMSLHLSQTLPAHRVIIGFLIIYREKKLSTMIKIQLIFSKIFLKIMIKNVGFSHNFR